MISTSFLFLLKSGGEFGSITSAELEVTSSATTSNSDANGAFSDDTSFVAARDRGGKELS